MTDPGAVIAIDPDATATEEARAIENTQLGIALRRFRSEAASEDPQAAIAPYNAAL